MLCPGSGKARRRRGEGRAFTRGRRNHIVLEQQRRLGGLIMFGLGKFRSALVAGWACLFVCIDPSAVAQNASSDPAQLLKHADDIKSANHNEFTALLRALADHSARLTTAQQQQLRYLKAWQSAYTGDYASAIPQLEAVIAESKDSTLTFRAGGTAVNVLALASRNEEAFSRLDQLLDLLPDVSDPEARQQGLIVAGQLYNQVGQYELAES